MTEKDQATGIEKKLFEIQKLCLKLKKDKLNPFHKSKYADLVQVQEVLIPELNKRNILLKKVVTEDGLTVILKDLDDGSSEYSSMLWMSNSDVQTRGKDITYFSRYLLCPMVNLVADDDDDDGNHSAQQTTRTSAPATTEKRAPTYKAGEVLVVVDEIQELVSKNFGTPYTLIKTDQGNFAVFDKGVMDGITIVPGDSLNMMINEKGYVTSIR